MKFTQEQMAVIAKSIADRKMGMLGGIQMNIGDAFNAENLASALGRVESQSLIDGRVIAARRYANLIPVSGASNAAMGTALKKGFTDAIGIGRPYSGSFQDAPLADVVYGSQIISVDAGNVAYSYSVPELQAASRDGVPLATDKAAAAQLAYEKHMYKVAMVGEPETGKLGLLNHDIPEVTTATDSWSVGNIDAIMNDLSDAIGLAYDESELTGDTSMLPNTILLPSKHFRLLNTLRVSATSEKTLLSYIRENNLLTESGVENVRFESIPELNTAGAGRTPRIVIYRRDPSAIEFIIPQDLEYVAPQAKGLQVHTEGFYLYAGLWIKSPKAVLYLDGA